MTATPAIGAAVAVAPSDRYPAGRIGSLKRTYSDDFGRWFEVESSKDPGVIWTLTEQQVSDEEGDRK